MTRGPTVRAMAMVVALANAGLFPFFVVVLPLWVTQDMGQRPAPWSQRERERAATPTAFRSRMAAGVAFLSSCLKPFATQGMGFVVERATFSSTGGLPLASPESAAQRQPSTS